MAEASPISFQKELKGSDYPVSKADLSKHAEQQGLNDNVPSELEQLPEPEYDPPPNVNQASGELE